MATPKYETNPLLALKPVVVRGRDVKVTQYADRITVRNYRTNKQFTWSGDPQVRDLTDNEKRNR